MNGTEADVVEERLSGPELWESWAILSDDEKIEGFRELRRPDDTPSDLGRMPRTVGPGPMPSNRRHGDLIGPHRRGHARCTGETAQTRKIVSAAGLDQRQRARRPCECANGAVAGHMDRHQTGPLL